MDQVFKEFGKKNSDKLDKEEAYDFLKVTLKEQLGTEPDEEDLERNFRIMDEN